MVMVSALPPPLINRQILLFTTYTMYVSLFPLRYITFAIETKAGIYVVF